MRKMYREQIYDMGDYMEVKIFPVFKKSRRRGRKAKPTKEMQKRLNKINSMYNLYRLIMWNFGEDDIFLDLTYDPNVYEPQTREDANRAIKNFLQRLRRKMRKQGIELKYIYVTEQGKRSHRFHHHLIINGGLSMQEISELWGYGHTKMTNPQPDEAGYLAKAMYMYKQSGNETYKEELKDSFEPGEEPEEEKYQRGWSSSKNLIRKDPAERDCRIGESKVRAMSIELENAVHKTLDACYPGYHAGYALAINNEANGGYFIHAILYKQDAAFLKRRYKRRIANA